MKNNILAAVLSLIIPLCVPVCFSASAAEDEFYMSYIAESFDGDTLCGSVSGDASVCDGIYNADGRALRVKNAEYTLPYNGIAADFRCDFDVFVPELSAEAEIELFSDKAGIALILESKSESELNLLIQSGDERRSLTTLLKGKWYTAEAEVSTSSAEFMFRMGGAEYHGKYFADTVFESIAFRADEDLYTDNIKVYCGAHAAGQKPVIYKTGNFVAAEVRLPRKAPAKLIIAAYNSDNMLTDVNAVICNEDMYQKPVSAFIKYNDSIAVYKAFLLYDTLAPAEMNDIHAQGEVFYSEADTRASAVITASDNNVSAVSAAELCEEVSDVRLCLYRDNLTVKETELTAAEYKSDGIELDISDLERGEYTAVVYTVIDDKYIMPAGRQTFTVRGDVPQNDTYIFCVGSPYYLHNDSKEYFYEDDKSYFPIYAGDELYISADFINERFGVEAIGDNVQNTSVYPIGGSMEAAGYSRYFDNSGIYAVSLDPIWTDSAQSVKENAERYRVKFEEAVFSDGFESESKNWQKLPSPWSFFNWSTSSSAGAYGTAELDSEHGTSVYLEAMDKSFSGFQSDSIDADKICDGCSISVDIYTDSDYTGNYPGISLMMNGPKSDTDDTVVFKKKVNGSEVSEYARHGEWVTVTAEFPKDVTDNAEYTSFRILLYTARDNSEKSAGGRVYFDNVVLNADDYPTDSIKADIHCTDELSWYTIGDTAVYTASVTGLAGVESVEGVVYNTDGDEVFRQTVSAYTVINDGWKYKPDTTGYYEAEFYGIRKDGTKAPIINYYSKLYNNAIGHFELPRHAFAIAAKAAKSQNERNESLLISTHALSPKDAEIGNMLGYSGARIHWIRWGDSATVKGINTARGIYDWTNSDMQFKNVEEHGLRVVAADVFGTPKWAVKEEYRDLDKISVAGSYYFNNYAPENMNDLADFISAFVERYGGRMDILEFWNEPTKTPTAFWMDSVPNFASMMKTAYTSAKKVRGDLTVSLGGVGNNANYTQFYNDLLSDADIYGYYDLIAFHGTYDVNRQLNDKVTAEHGLSPKEWWNSEGYFGNYCQNKIAADSAEQAKAFVVSTLQNFKAGAKYVTTFQMQDIIEDEYRVFVNLNGGSKSTYGLFRSYPYTEPKLSAVAAFNLFELMNADFEYMGENEFGNVRAVTFKNGGDTLTAMWSKDSGNFAIPPQLGGVIGSDAKLTDMEGRDCNTDSVLGGERIYYLTGVSQEALSPVMGFNMNNVLNPAMPAPYYNTTPDTEDSSSDVRTADMNYTPLFDTESMTECAGGEVKYISGGWAWNSEQPKPNNFSAEYAAYIDQSGMQIMVDVTDDVHVCGSGDAADISVSDSMRLAVDCGGTGLPKDRTEYTAALTDSGAKLYKGYAADIGNNIPLDYTNAYSEMPDKYIKADRTENHTVYKIFIPKSELYPYAYPGGGVVRMKISVTDNDGDGAIGELTWGSNESETAPMGYGKICCGVVLSYEKTPDGRLKLAGSTLGNSDTVTIRVMKEGKIFHLKQLKTAVSGSFSDSFPAEAGEYEVYVCGGGYKKNYMFKLIVP